jgi:hypothetical protein
MGMEIRVSGADQVSRKLRSARKRIEEQTARYIYESEIRPLGLAIRQRGSSFGGPAKLAANSVQINRLAKGGQIKAPMGGGLNAKLFFGSEFGGRRRPKKAYVTRSRHGRPYIVRRRTTQQFGPYLGTHGYFFFPTTRTLLKGLRARVTKVVVKAVNSG